MTAARARGFTLVEVCSFPAHLDCHDAAQVGAAADLLRELAMEANSLHAPYAEHIDISGFDDRQRDASVRELFVAAEAAQRLGCRYLVLHPGPEREGRPLRPPSRAASRPGQRGARAGRL